MSKTKAKGAGRRRKVALPCDRDGVPIHVGDLLMWDDGTTLKVATLTYYGPDYERMGAWTAEDEHEDFSDNLAGSVNVSARRW